MITNRRLVNPRIIGIMLVAASLLIVTTGSQNAMGGQRDGSIRGGDVLIEEAAEAEAGNATMTAGENETADGNMTGTNSTS